MNIHTRIRLELRGVRAVWCREQVRFEETGLTPTQRTARLEQLRRRSLTVLVSTAEKIEASGGDADELSELMKLREQIAAASSRDGSLPILAACAAEPSIERRPSFQRPTGAASRDRHQRQP